jgi:hypothetical protein
MMESINVKVVYVILSFCMQHLKLKFVLRDNKQLIYVGGKVTHYIKPVL